MGGRPPGGPATVERADRVRSERVHSGSSRPPVTRPGARPLIARPDIGTAPEPGAEDRHDQVRAGRVRRFVHRYGWRAYAVPLLTVLTLAALGDLAANGSDTVATPAEPIPSVATTTAAPSPTPLASADEETVPDLPPAVDAAPSEVAPAPGAQTYVEKGAGTVSIIDGTSPVYGSGPLRRFVVEVENGIGVDGAAFAEAVRETLRDPRSWGNGGRYSFQQVGAAQAAAAQYDFKVTLISPGHMDAYCPGLRTNGYTSCRVGERAVINLARWATAVPHYDGDIATYRHYVVNHEVGHALGNGHQDCPGAGAVAPVMQQQTLGLDGCVKNAWPYP